LIAIGKDGADVEVVAFDSGGEARPEWAEALRRRSAPVLRMSAEDAADYDWAALVTRLAPLVTGRRPHAIAAVVVRRIVAASRLHDLGARDLPARRPRRTADPRRTTSASPSRTCQTPSPVSASS
jgi:hypothetical protein